MYANEINHEKYLNAITGLIGKEMDLNFETIAKFDEIAGKYKVLEFVKYDEYKIKTSTWKESFGKVESIKYGTLKIQFIDTKKYKGKIFTFEVELYTGFKYDEEKIFIDTKRLEDGKYLKAYRFAFINI